MLLDANQTAAVAIAGLALAAVGTGTGIAAGVRLSRLRRSYAAVLGGSSQPDLLATVDRHVREVADLRGEVVRAREVVSGLRADLRDALRHVAVVRYDAFQDMGGRLSFSAALLDDAGDGLVLTSINGRSETRSYAKGVKGGRSEATLSPEEQQAVTFALRATGATGDAAARLAR